MVETMDDAVGVVMVALEQAGIADNTLVIFMSDNGGLSTSEGHPTSNLPYRAGKGWLYDGGIREPMIVRFPGTAAAGSASDEPVVSMDFYPTILEATGFSEQPQQHVDGRSLLPVLRGERITERPLFFHYPHYGNQGGSPGSAVRLGDYKLIRFYEDDHFELYNLAADPGESTDLAASDKVRVDELNALLTDWLTEADAEFPSRNERVSQ